MSDNRKSFTPRDMLTSGGNGDIGCATPFGYVTVRYQGGEIVSVTVDGDRFVPGSGKESIEVAIDMLEDYASALGNGDLDGAGHSTTASIHEVIDQLAAAPQPQKEGE